MLELAFREESEPRRKEGRGSFGRLVLRARGPVQGPMGRRVTRGTFLQRSAQESPRLKPEDELRLDFFLNSCVC